MSDVRRKRTEFTHGIDSVLRADAASRFCTANGGRLVSLATGDNRGLVKT